LNRADKESGAVKEAVKHHQPVDLGMEQA
jgi:hypothetical protein